MCIRDSIKGEWKDLPVFTGNVVTAEGVDALVEAGADAIKAVSYTHLRAHETVLDLVCRLLLEKKKSTETQRRP